MIISFSDIKKEDIELVGGKAINLGRMIQAGFPVPQGFCITTEVFSLFLEESGSSEEIYNLLDNCEVGDTLGVKSISEEIRVLLLKTEIPDSIKQIVEAEWNRIGAEKGYAVRSSATAEDLPEASFAGQQSTYLNIHGIDELFLSIKECWISLFSDRSILYRIKNSFNHRDIKLAVVIQEMVESEKSGVMFTADPLTSNLNSISIDASYGLGETLVSGLVNPDHFSVDKSSMVITERTIGDKTLQIKSNNKIGTVEEDIPEDLRSASALTDNQIVELSKIGLEIEKYYGIPQDIEWAIVNDQIYILQVRPITSLFPVDIFKSLNDGYRIYFSMGHQQNMTNAMTPLSMNCMQNVIPLGRIPGFKNRLLIDTGGYLYADLTRVLRHPVIGKKILHNLGMLDSRLPLLLEPLTRKEEFRKQKPMRFTPIKILYLIIAFIQISRNLFFKDNYNLYKKVNDKINTFISKVSMELDQKNNRKKIQIMIDALQDVYKTFAYWGPALVTGMIANRLLPKFGKSLLNNEEIEALSLGLPGNSVTEMNLELGDLADSVRESPELIRMFDRLDMDYDSWLIEVKQCCGTEEFLNKLQDFLDRYGARGLSEIELMNKRWHEDPTPLLRVIRGNLDRESGHHRAVEESLKRRRKKATQKLITNSKGIKRLIVKRFVKVLEDGGILREHHKFAVIQVFDLIRGALKELAIELVEEKKLLNKDDIWFLYWSELLNIHDDQNINYIEIIRERRERFKTFKKLTPPMIVTSTGEVPTLPKKKDQEEGVLTGNPVSLGVYEGLIHVIRDPQTERLNPGEILVTRFTDPGWTPLFINAEALIMEVGGLMTHGSVVAREYNIPAVVGVDNATKLLKTGQRVEVDGNKGTIKIL